MKKAFLLVTVLVLASAGNAMACKCAMANQEFGYATRNSPLIFSGQLVGILHVKKDEEAGAYAIKIFKFVPDKIWRGTKADTITLISGNNNCDVMLKKGHYVVYTDSSQDLNRCDRTVASNIEKETMKLDKLFTRKRFKQLQAAS